MNLAAVFMTIERVAENETVQRGVVDWLLLFSGITTALTVLGGAFIWLVWPRLREYLKKELITPVRQTHQSVTVNGGKNNPPTMLDKVHAQGERLETLAVQLDTLAQVLRSNRDRTNDLGDKVDLLSELTQETRNALKDHERSGENYLGTVIVELGKHGIVLPPAEGDKK